MNFTRIIGKYFGKFDYFLFCALACIGKAFKMKSFYKHTALAHHISRDGRIYSAGKQKKSPAVAACGHTAHGSFLTGAEICGFIADFGSHHDLGIVNVNLYFSVCPFEDRGAYF